MNLVESAPKDSVAAKFAIDNRGNLKKVIILILKKKNCLNFHIVRQFSIIRSILEKYSLSTLTFEKRLK